jgi:hypothetical protein
MDAALAERVIRAVDEARRLVRASAVRKGNELVFPPLGELIVTGDLHGDVDSFDQLLGKVALDANPDRRLVLQELVHGHDLPDGSTGSCCLVERAASLVARFPGRVHLIMGNHEMAEFSGRTIIKQGVVLNEALKRSAEARYGPLYPRVIEAFHEFWRALPLAARTSNRVFISHSMPSRRSLESFDASVLRRPLVDRDFERVAGSAYALLWGRDFSPEAADALRGVLDADFFICGHTPCADGFSAINGRQLILDSQGPAGKYLVLPLSVPLTHDEIIGNIRPVWN